ncbi:MAG TPA: hypothetical protein VGK10_03875 [Prolixibacteraceae bacterium]|jgi:hypothetical protein
MNQRYSKCSEVVTHKRIVLSENQSKITFLNPAQKEIERVTVDGCALKNGMKCDFLLIEDGGAEHFVELKGCDIDHAIDQLVTTIKILSKCSRTYIKFAYIVSSRCPLSTTKIQGLQLRFKKDFNSKLIMRKLKCEILI